MNLDQMEVFEEIGREILDEALLEEWDKRYELYGLKYNPFYISAIAPKIPKLPPLDSTVLEEIIEFIGATYRKQEFGGMVIIGDYGMGKSHTLKFIAHLINSYFGNIGDGKAEAIYVEEPKVSTFEVVSAMLSDIGEENIRKRVWHVIAHRFRQHVTRNGFSRFSTGALFEKDEAKREHLLSDQVVSNYKLFLQDYGSLFLDEDRLREFAQRELVKLFYEDAMITKEFDSFLFEKGDKAEKAWDTIRGLGAGGRKFAGKVRVDRFFNSLIEIFKDNGFRHIYLLIDEFEDVPGYLSKQDTVKYLSQLRGLIDRNTECFSLILGVRDQAWEVIKNTNPAFFERMSRRVELVPLSEGDTRKIIESHLSLARKEDYEDKIKPFDPQLIPIIQREKEGNLRAVLETCFKLLDAGAREQEPVIDESFYRKVMGTIE